MRNKLIIGIGLSLTILGLYLVFLSQQPAKDARAGTIIRTVNVIGTATTTAGTTNFPLAPATTTSSDILLGGNVDIVDLDIYPESASSTSHFNMQILKSSNPRCAQTGGNEDWVDAISSNSVATNITTLATGTSTVIVTNATGLGGGKKYQLTNVNAHCLRVVVGAQSVNLYIQGILKTLSF